MSNVSSNDLSNTTQSNTADSTVIRVSRWKTSLSFNVSIGDVCSLDVYDDGNQNLPRGCKWVVVGVDFGGAKVMLRRA